ncbi:hypothetical protein [Halomonas huangheensis]|uniref:Transmembrane protein n=1 Tax=Halomonas huangheensis TaxID=1178482 RepID=W1NAD0_9GAMM|nr:hypothetical protein [Halomonas huangheensis]ALM54093.1 hypothetical protein AR456_18785 [Halomonas huangheensis]ERL52517.1 hypothetical protein BJB45_08165 [Halomonas huangheensis]
MKAFTRRELSRIQAAVKTAVVMVLRSPALIAVSLALTLIYGQTLQLSSPLWWVFPLVAFTLQVWATALSRRPTGDRWRFVEDIRGLVQLLLMLIGWVLLVMVVFALAGVFLELLITLVQHIGNFDLASPPPPMPENGQPLVLAAWHEAHVGMLVFMGLFLVLGRWALYAGYLVMTHRLTLRALVRLIVVWPLMEWMPMTPLAVISGCLLVVMSVVALFIPVLSLLATPILAVVVAFAFALGGDVFSDDAARQEILN